MIDQPQPTNQQLIAINEHDANLAVVAGAGSGKTYVLVERYLSLLEENDWLVESLVAITFTEKAAREMRDRVRLRVEQKAEEVSKSGDPILSRRWSAHRNNLDRAMISTIHSLCALLLRRFAAEAAIDPRFEVIEEIDARLLQSKAISEVLAELDAEGGVELELYSHYEAQTIVDTLKQLLANGSAVDDQMKKLPGSEEEILETWRNYQQSLRSKLLEKLRQDDQWREASQWIANNAALRPDDKLETIRATVATRIHSVHDPDLAEACNALRDIRAAIKLNVGSKDAWGSKNKLDAAKQMLRTLREYAETIIEEMGPDLGEADETAAGIIVLWRHLYQRVLNKYQTYKEFRSVLDFDDLEQRARGLLINRPDVAERCRLEIRHLLVDEFQDTSPVQRDIIYQLAPPNAPGRLFVVGDPKQSIYRFRGADISLFRQVQTELRDWGGQEVHLFESYRSHECLVKSFNKVFRAIFGDDDDAPYEVSLGNDMLAKRQTRAAHGPIIEMLLVPQQIAQMAKEEDLDDDQVTGSGTTKISVHDSRRWQAFWLAARLREMVEEGYEVWDKQLKAYRPMRYDDVAILFRASTGFQVFEEVFKAVGLRYVTLAGKGYFKRQEVWDLVNLLKALDNPFDDLSLASVLRSPLFGLSDEALFALRQIHDPLNAKRPLPLYQALDVSSGIPESDQESVEFARHVISRLRSLAGRASLLEILHYALRETAYLATISALTHGERRRGNVEKLLALARTAPSNSLTDFTARLAMLRDQEARESEALVDTKDAVQLMTVHAAKGLEFPTVVIADAGSAGSPKPPSGPLLPHPTLGYVCRFLDDETGKLGTTAGWEWGKISEMDAGLAEEKRVLYVAATRAQDYLIVAGKPTQSKSLDGGNTKPGSWLDRFLNALEYSPIPSLDEDQQHEELLFDWGTVKVRWLETPKDDALDESEVPRDPDDETSEKQLAEDGFPLAMPIRENPLAVLEDFTATDLIEIGLEMDPSPEHLAESLRVGNKRAWTIARERVHPYVPGRIVGEITHRALEQWRLPSRTPRPREVLESFAWNCGLTDALAIERAVDQAYNLLQRFERSSLCQEMKEAEATRRHEVPFVFKRNGRMVHGSIDAMFQRASGRWVVIDFKTDIVPGGREILTKTPVKGHLIQVGIYAEAVTNLIGDTPAVLLHYIRYGHTVLIPEAVWKEQIQKLGW